MKKTRIIIMGAAGRDFHNFQVCYKNDPSVEVVAFTAAQIPGIENRIFPAALSGPLYPQGIPIFPEGELPRIIQKYQIEQVVFAYSDISHTEVMHRASLVMALGLDFAFLGPERTMLKASVPVISVCAVRTGCGKSGVTERICESLRSRSIDPVVIRHPMPYCDLEKTRVERFADFRDLDQFACTVEEREEYEHFIEKGIVVYAGVDYEAILRAAEKEAGVILWDGGNNDFPFIKSDLEIVVLDPHRPGHERFYHPGEVNFLRAQVLVVNKADTAPSEAVENLLKTAVKFNPGAVLVQTASRIHVRDEKEIRGKRVLVIEDGPTVTHGGMAYGAGVMAARRFGARETVDPRPFAVGTLKYALEQYPHLTDVLPAVGYFPEQLRDLEETIQRTPCDLVLVATPIDLTHLIKIPHPVLRVTYRIEDWGTPALSGVVDDFIRKRGLNAA